MMTSPKSCSELNFVVRAAIDDLMATSDEDLAMEAKEDNVDLASLDLLMKSSMRELAASALRDRMKTAKSKHSANSNGVVRPSIETIKSMVQSLFATNPSLKLAFREGKRQSDADWTSLYDDLVSLGAIQPKQNGTD